MSRQGEKARGQRIDSIETRARIMAAAEKLFAEKDIDGVSLSEIHAEAGQRNRSAINYHFGSKEKIIAEIIEKHEADIRQLLQAMLEAMDTTGKPGLRETIEAMVVIFANKLYDPDGGMAYIRLMAQLIGDPRFAVFERHLELIERGTDLVSRITRSVLEAPGGKRTWLSRWIFLTGLMFHALADYSKLAETASDADLPSRKVFVQDLINASAALLKLPLTPENIFCKTIEKYLIVEQQQATSA